MPVPNIKPIGIGDLKVVKQKLMRYEAGEVSHIENVLAREQRKRVLRTLNQIEETDTDETSVEQEDLKDVQSTERFELDNESQHTMKSDTSFNAGLDLSASYGSVQLSASAKFAMTNSKEDSDKESTKYAKDVTARSLSRLVQKTKQIRTVRTLNEVKEKNLHGFDNTTGDQNIAGIYRWVDKYYRNKVVDYGKRVFYEFVVPEPAIFYLFATLANLNAKVLPQKPVPPTDPWTGQPLKANDITRSNYLMLLNQYAAQGFDAPPPADMVVAKSYARQLAEDYWTISSDEFKVPKGYAASYGAYSVDYTYEDNGNPHHGVLLLGTNAIDVGSYPSLVFNNESDVIPVSGTGYNLKSFALNVEASCYLLPDAYERWQLKTYGAIMAAYNKAQLDYEDKLAAAQVDSQAQLGSSPDLNRELERRELKKACIRLWADFVLGSISAIDVSPTATPPGNYPDVNVSGALALEEPARFFEESFEWSNMSYEMLPYFWGRKAAWTDAYSLQCADPLFENFLKAGAARVTVPVKPSQTERVLYYQLSGVIWPGGTIPALSTLTDPDAVVYNGYIQELVGVPDMPDIDQEVPIDKDDPSTWVTKVPTTLVWLQSDDQLPNLEP
jgi:hypothetical protein